MSELKLQQCRLDGRYDILECLGRGSYAEIYVSRDIAAADGDPRMVVIKALNLQLQGTIDEELERTLIENFQNEAVALDRVRHPHIINRLGHGTAIDLMGTTFHYIVLEYMPGGNLLDICRKRPLPLERSLFYLEQVSAGLSHAHECGVIHRDIKPQNLLLTADHQTVKIADFGVAKLDATEGVITRVGTNVYAAPEHNPQGHTGPLDTGSLSSAQPHLTPAADIYSLAKTTYTLLAGESPRRFSQRQITELPASLVEQPWARHVLRVLKRATETRPDRRYQTVQEFWEELADATMPRTQLLDPLEGTQVSTRDAESNQRPTGKLPTMTEVATTPPPRPRFNSKRVIEQAHAHGNGSVRPRIVVPVEKAQVEPQPPARRPAQDIIDEMPDVPQPLEASKPPLYASRMDSRVRRYLVALALILAFAGMLFATHSYIRSRWGTTANNTATTNTTPPSLVGHEGIINTDVNLHSGPGKRSPLIGLAERNSRVKVLSVSDNWYEVQILQHGREKDDPESEDRGWMYKDFLRLD